MSRDPRIQDTQYLHLQCIRGKQYLCLVSIIHNVTVWYLKYTAFMSGISMIDNICLVSAKKQYLGLVSSIHKFYVPYPWYTLFMSGIHDAKHLSGIQDMPIVCHRHHERLLCIIVIMNAYCVSSSSWTPIVYHRHHERPKLTNWEDMRMRLYTITKQTTIGIWLM